MSFEIEFRTSSYNDELMYPEHYFRDIYNPIREITSQRIAVGNRARDPFITPYIMMMLCPLAAYWTEQARTTHLTISASSYNYTNQTNQENFTEFVKAGWARRVSYGQTLSAEEIANKPEVNYIVIGEGRSFFFDQLTIASEELHELKSVSIMLQEDRYHKIRVCYIREYNKLLVFTNKFYPSTSRKLLGILPALLGWMIPDGYQEILKLFTQNDNFFVEWQGKLIDLYERMKIKDSIEKKRLAEFVATFYKKQLQEQARQLTTYRQQEDEYLHRLNETYQAIQKAEREQFSLTHGAQDTGFAEFFAYMGKHPYVKHMSPGTNSQANIVFVNVRAPIVYYSTDAIATFKNKNSCGLWEPGNPAWVKDLFLDVLSTGKYTLYCESSIGINFGKNFVEPSNLGGSKDDYRYKLRNLAIPHPHITRYACWGTNLSYIQRSLTKKDYIQAWEQAMAAMQSINLLDSPVMGTLNMWVRNENHYKTLPSLEDNTTHEVISINQYIERWNKEHETNHTDG